MARSTKAFSSSVLGSPLGSGASESSIPSKSFAGWGNVPGQLVSLGRSGGPLPLRPCSLAFTAPFLSFRFAPLSSWSISSLRKPAAVPSWLILSSHSGWGRLSCYPLPPIFISPISVLGRTIPGSSLRHPFPAEPRASLGSRRNRLQNAGARPRCLRAPPVSRPAPAAQTPARLALRAGRPLRCCSQASRAPTVCVPVRGPPQEARQPAARPAPACAPGPGSRDLAGPSGPQPLVVYEELRPGTRDST